MDPELNPTPTDLGPMARALELAALGEGAVEPNPMVGCVLTREGKVVGEGYHERFGGPHAEVNAIAQAGERARGATAYVTLEPCCHHGKTPPCVDALLAAGVARVVAACEDPNPKVAGNGVAMLRAAGVECEVGLGHKQAEELMAPYLKRLRTGKPWVIAKWAMSLDGKIATRSGDSQWISGEASRSWVHDRRGRVDAVVVGAATLVADDPLLTARPQGPRTPARVVVADTRALPRDRRLFMSPEEGPVYICIDKAYPGDNRAALEKLGVEVVEYDHESGLTQVLDELGRRGMTNVLVEGGGKLLGRLFDERLVDETHVFVAPMLIGGVGGPAPVGGDGAARIADALRITPMYSELLGQDLHMWGRLV